MNKLITRINEDFEKKFSVLVVLVNTMFSCACALITQNLGYTILYNVAVGFLNIIAVIYDFSDLEKAFQKILSIRGVEKYYFFILPLLLFLYGVCCGELNLFCLESYCKNLLPNLFGALTVFSLFHHISKFELESVRTSFLQAKKFVIMLAIPVSFNVAFLNSINYELKNALTVSSFLNALHLFVVIFWGFNAVVILVLYIANQVSHRYTGRQLYPRTTLLWMALFLISCSLPSVYLPNLEQSRFLLLLNTISAVIAAWGLLIFILFHTSKEKKSNAYPWIEVIVFSMVLIYNLLFCLDRMNIGTNLTTQTYSGGIVLFGCLILLFARK